MQRQVVPHDRLRVDLIQQHCLPLAASPLQSPSFSVYVNRLQIYRHPLSLFWATPLWLRIDQRLWTSRRWKRSGIISLKISLLVRLIFIYFTVSTITELAVGRLSRSRGTSSALPNLPEWGLHSLISDVVAEMKTRRPCDTFDFKYPFQLQTGKGFSLLITCSSTGRTDREPQRSPGRKMLRAIALNTFELLCYEVCFEIKRRYLNDPLEGLKHPASTDQPLVFLLHVVKTTAYLSLGIDGCCYSNR